MNCTVCGNPLAPRRLGLGYKSCEECRERQAANSKHYREQRRVKRGMVIGYEEAAAILRIPAFAVEALEQTTLVLHRHSALNGEPVFAIADLVLLGKVGYGDPRLKEDGAQLPKECPSCGGRFVGPAKSVYCGAYCKQRLANQRHYQKNRESILARMSSRRKKSDD